jgi:putative ABC transport system permease protein
MRAMGMRVTAGRLIGAAETATSRRVCVVNEAFARTYPGEAPLDATVPDDAEDFALVGVVADVTTAVAERVGPEVFVCQTQWPSSDGGDPVIAIRTLGPTIELAPLVRSVVADIDPTLAVGRIATMEERVAEQLARPRLYTALLTAFAVLALAVAGAGLFGVLSFSVAQRARAGGSLRARRFTRASCCGWCCDRASGSPA